MIIRSLELYIHADVWDEYGNEVSVHTLILVDRDGQFRLIDYSPPENEQEKVVTIPRHIAQKLLKSFVHELNAPFWATDLSDSETDCINPSLDVLLEHDNSFKDENNHAPNATSSEKEPICRLKLALNSGKTKEITFYNQLHEEPQSMFWMLMNCFEPMEYEL